MDEACKHTEKSSQETKTKSPGDKLKNETSAREAVRKKLRYGKKDNSLTLEEEKALKKQRQQGRKMARAEAIASAKAHENISRSNEDENVGTEAANRGAEFVENGVRHVRNAHYSRKLHEKSKQPNKMGNVSMENMGNGYHSTAGTCVNTSAGTSSGATAKELQKKRIQREMIKTAEKKKSAEAAKKAGKKGADKAGDVMDKIWKVLAKVLKENSGIIPVLLIIGIVVLIISTCLSSCSIVAGSLQNASVASSYTADDSEILASDAYYSDLETDLRNEINSIETDYPGYDEYNYTLDEIGHNPYQLAAILTVLYEDYTFSEVQGMLDAIFDAQYELTVDAVVETRTRTETRTGTRTVWDDTAKQYVTEEYTYEVEVEYEYYILNVTLTNLPMETVLHEIGLSEDQIARYRLLVETYGNKKHLFGGDIYGNQNPGDYQDYTIPPEHLTDQQFANMIRCAEQFLGYPYVWGGSSPQTSFDCSGFVSYVINNCGNGWSVGRQTANGLLNCCTRIPESEAKPGDLIFFQGTYNTSGASHVGIYVGNGMMIHCGNPIQYASINTSYWRQHFYTFGRIN